MDARLLTIIGCGFHKSVCLITMHDICYGEEYTVHYAARHGPHTILTVHTGNECHNMFSCVHARVERKHV